MKKFEINEKQLNVILTCLAEVPSKFSYQSVKVIENLKEIKEDVSDSVST